MILLGSKNTILFVVFLGVAFIGFPVLAADVGGIINADTTWDLAGSPYNIIANVKVAEGVTLTIEPGVSVSGNTYGIKVWGILNANGKFESKIYFNNVSFENFSTGNISIKFAEIKLGSSQTITVQGGSLTLMDSRLEDTYRIYLGYPSQDCFILRNSFINSQGIDLVSSGDTKIFIENNLFLDWIGWNQYTYAIYSSANYDTSEVIVKNNTFINKDRVAIRLEINTNCPRQSVDASYNFWNTIDEDIIESMIYDRNDDLSVCEYVLYEPFLSSPHPDTPPSPLNVICISTATDFQTALTNATSNGIGDVIQIMQGTYNGNFIYASTEPYGLTIEGGYLPGCVSRVVDPANTVLDAEDNGSVLVLSAPEVAADFMVDGMTLKNGNGILDVNGAGLFAMNNGKVTLTNNLIQNNNTVSSGGGIYINSSSNLVTLVNNTISYNSANGNGGGCYINSSGAVNISNNIIFNNNGRTGGGGYFFSRSGSVTLTNNAIINNSAYDSGGFYINSNSSSVAFKNNIISDNSANTHGGGGYFYIWSGTATLTNNTISNNSANLGGGGAYILLIYDDATINIYNNIVWNNNAEKGGDLYLRNDGNSNYIPSTVNLFNNNFDQSIEGTYIQISFPIDPSNLNNEDPLFVDPADGDFHLTKESPCRDAGDNDAPELPDTDMDGELRILDGFVDIGADEYSAPPCKADFDDDKLVNDIDLYIFSFAMGEADCTWWPPLCVCDIDNDGDVDGADLAVLISEFGRSDCP